jgi:hypothetical protein
MSRYVLHLEVWTEAENETAALDRSEAIYALIGKQLAPDILYPVATVSKYPACELCDRPTKALVPHPIYHDEGAPLSVCQSCAAEPVEEEPSTPPAEEHRG